jgi:hypothetical protein
VKWYVEEVQVDQKKLNIIAFEILQVLLIQSAA